MKNKWMNALFFSLPFAVSASTVYANPVELQALSDQELSDVNGQALLSLSYISPTDAENKMAGNGVGFYKLGMEADVKLNANIRSLQLGCGGINGAGNCDIDIDNLSLSGVSDTRDGRASSSAVLTNPFVEFAIKNPNSSSTREVVGLRLSAEKVLGLLTMGEENSDKPNGINSLSGYLKILPTTGVASTTVRSMTYNDTKMNIDGNIRLLLNTGSGSGYSTNDYDLGLESARANLSVNGTTITGSRMNSANLTGVATIGGLDFSGRIVARLNSALVNWLPVPISARGQITGLTADLKISENLGFIHKLPVNNPFSLSLQSQSVFWPGATVAANRGWWLALEDGIDIGQVTPSNTIDISDDILKQVVPHISQYLKNNPSYCPLVSCAITGLNIGNVNLTGSKPLNFPIQDLKLATQNFAPNCYGNLKFC